MLASVIPDMIVLFNDIEAQFRALVALGTLICVTENEQRKSIQEKIVENNEFLNKLKSYKSQYNNESDQKLLKCAQEVQNILVK